ncbi:sigma-70 family RNA polymerase sigma factor [Clostridiales bacterium BAD-6]|uniref:Sigma-70 family RNA polymerase sigma factor n=2 Tax=Sinanaerobacter chloroacetimidivorans TaxID=2818044 RepID=A0A8J7W146_9FIRM|nr:sigma-70 family RNA polymerase sigma factor [Sinanaerobacter chloroacetimidivorans]
MVAAAIDQYADMVRRICFLHLSNRSDVEDVFQEVFLQYYLNFSKLQNEQHEKAWLCRVTFNKCKDLNKSFWRKKVVSLDEMEIPFENEEQSEIIIALLQLPSKYKDVVYLHYYEGRSIPEIAKIMSQNTNTIYSRLRRAKEKLKVNEGVIEWNG